jgi:outer membrane protein
MKRLVFKRELYVAAAFLLLGSFVVAGDLKIATINMEKVFDDYYKTKALNIQFKARSNEAEVKRQELEGKFNALKGELQTLTAGIKDKSLSEQEREKKRELAEEKYAQVKEADEKVVEFDKTTRKQLAEDMRVEQQKIVAEIKAAISKYCKEQAITLVLDSSGKTMNNVEAVVLADPSYDVTEKIIEIMNRNAPENLDNEKGKKALEKKESKQ